MNKKSLKHKQKKHKNTTEIQRKRFKTSHKLNHAVQLHTDGQLAEAAKIYQEILSEAPDNPDALHLSGLIAMHDQHFDTAKKLITKAIDICPSMPSFHVNMGRIHHSQEGYPQALSCFQKAINLQNDTTEAYFYQGNTYRSLHDEPQAIKNYRKALSYTPEHVPSLNNLGNALKELGKFEEALKCYKQALQIDPNIAEAYTNMGNLYKDLRDAEKALSCYQEAVKIRPNYAEALNNIGYILQHTGNLTEALHFLQRALDLKPDTSEILHNIGNVYKDIGQFNQAIEVYQKALAITPTFTDVHSNILFAMNYAEDASPETMFKESQKWWQQQAAHLPQFAHTPSPPHKHLRIGYVSADFCIHSVSFFFLSLLKAHNKEKYKIYCYSDVANTDSMTEELKLLSSEWIPIFGMTDEALSNKIHEDQIDILVDLSGHTSGNRLLSFARKAAPIQVSWLGYPNTTGIPAIDYRITDDIADPTGLTDSYYSEKLIRLPQSFLCYSPPNESPEVSPLPALKTNKITFGSFNNITKLTNKVIQTWARILNDTPNSQLLLKGTTLADKQIRQNFMDTFSELGVAPEKIILRERTSSISDHLALYHDMDIALDPFPYNGTTTTCEALWMGVPVITLAGEVHCSRVGSSILTNSGLAQFTCQTVDQYINKAVQLAHNLPLLDKTRATLRKKISGSTIFDQKNFASNMEKAYMKMWEKWCQKESKSMTKENSAVEYNEKGEILFNQGHAAEALELFQKAIHCDPDFGPAHNNIGVIFSHADKQDEAIKYFKKAVSINPLDQDAIDNLSNTLAIIYQSTPSPLPKNTDQPLTTDKLADCSSIRDEKTMKDKTNNTKMIIAEIEKFPFWYHKIKLPGGITTPGWAPIKPNAYRIPKDLSGKRVLDIGAWDGYWTFEALKRGASEVIAIDDFSDYLGELGQRDRKAWETFDLCKKALGYSDHQCKRVELSIYELEEKTFGHFDIVFFFGTLYHLRYPLLALDKISAICDEALFVESAILDDFSPYRGGIDKGYANKDMVMEFYPGTEYGKNDSNWWAPTLHCMVNMMAAAGFSDCQGWKLTDSPTELSLCRGFASGEKKNTSPKHIKRRIGESIKKSVSKHRIQTKNHTDAEEMNNVGAKFQQQGDLQQAFNSFYQAHLSAPDNPNFLINMGIIQIDQKEYDGAIFSLNQAINLKPDLAEAHFNLANALVHSGSPDKAVISYKDAISHNQDLTSAHTNLAVTLNSQDKHHEAIVTLHELQKKAHNNPQTLTSIGQTFCQIGEMEEAICSCNKALKFNPNMATAHNTIGLAYKAQKNIPKAVSSFKKAISYDPEFTEPVNNLGLVYYNTQDHKNAIKQFNNALKLSPENPEIYCNLAMALNNLGQTAEAIDVYQKALRKKPDYAAALNNIAQAYHVLGEVDLAENHFIRSAELDPEKAIVFFNLGLIKLEQGKNHEALNYFRRAIDLEPDNLTFRQQVAVSLRPIIAHQEDQRLKEDIQTCLTTEGICKDLLIRPAISLIKQNKSFISSPSIKENLAELTQSLQDGGPEFIKDPIFLSLLQNTVVADADIEELMTTLRRIMILQQNIIEPSQSLADFTCSLAHQCFINEYVYTITEKEVSRIQQLQKDIEESIQNSHKIIPYKIFLLGCFIPLYKVQRIDELSNHKAFRHDQFLKLFKRQIKEPLFERELIPKTKQITSISNAVSKAVRNQYEENPYPRWLDLPLTGPSEPFITRLKQKLPNISLPEIHFPENPNILVAGCGTGRESLQSSRLYSGSQITAVDLSRTSLAYASRKAKEYNISNINFLNGDILELEKLNQQFDIIESSGVLHHMDDPIMGWQVLTNILKSGGFMKIALYSEIARQPIVAARNFISHHGYPPSPDGIRRCRQEICKLPKTDPIRKIMSSKDFYTMSQCRDLIFHVQEHRFTTLQIRKAVDLLGLTFLGFVFDNSLLRSKYKKHFPDDTTYNNLENWHKFEQEYPDSFFGMYTFWLYKSTD